uniref:DUF7748 domain-containing protein n=1 Tax=Physcomitrium patens TaxID=3218 RepID=A0A2K1L371_PHYPA|nr:hypothetical protein PHYPA_003270 [Physcomitrium patens]
MEKRLVTRIINQTKQRLTLRVRDQNHFSKLVTIDIGEEYKMKTGLHWAHQEFSLETSIAAKKLTFNTDDCCESERITIHDLPGGKLEAHRVARTQLQPGVVEKPAPRLNSWICLPETLVCRFLQWQ